MNGNINMSLRHLYKDLDSLGMYPDLITSMGLLPNGNVKCKTGDDICNIITISFIRDGYTHMNKYYGPRLCYDGKVIFNNVILVQVTYTSSPYTLMIAIRESTYNVYFSQNSIDIKCNEQRRSMQSKVTIYHSSIFYYMTLLRYREITNIDSLCNLVRDVIQI